MVPRSQRLLAPSRRVFYLRSVVRSGSRPRAYWRADAYGGFSTESLSAWLPARDAEPPMLSTDPAEPIDRMLPTLPIDRIEPMLPIDMMLPTLPMLSTLVRLNRLRMLNALR